MTYTVVWRRSAECRLARIWTDATNRKSVQTAADSIDKELRQSPNDVGESRAAATRILTIPPLSVYYDVNEADRTVFVWAVWASRPT